MRFGAVVPVLLLLAFLLPVGCAQQGSAWSNGGYSSDFEHPDYGTHDWIADHALALLNASANFLSGTYHSEFLLGTEAPDNPDLIGDTREHHVYYRASGILQEDDCALRADAMYDAALLDLEQGNRSAAAYHAGAMVHYISDAAAYGHTMGNGTDWGVEQHHSDYEDAVNSFILTYQPDLALLSDITNAYTSTLLLARNITFGHDSLRPNTWMDSNYNWDSGEFVSSVRATLDSAILSVASSLESLLVESGSEPDDPSEDPPEEKKDNGHILAYLAGIGAAVFAMVAVIVARRRSRC